MSDSNCNNQSENLINDLSPQVIDDENAIVLVKHGQRYVFRYTPGHESDMLNQLALMVSDPDNDLDWFDAAVLSHRMGQRISKRMENLRKH